MIELAVFQCIVTKAGFSHRVSGISGGCGRSHQLFNDSKSATMRFLKHIAHKAALLSSATVNLTTVSVQY